jgi:hypothetical protein
MVYPDKSTPLRPITIAVNNGRLNMVLLTYLIQANKTQLSDDMYCSPRDRSTSFCSCDFTSLMPSANRPHPDRMQTDHLQPDLRYFQWVRYNLCRSTILSTSATSRTLRLLTT